MNGFNWKNIISHNGSQNNAFEELVCQLAREEIANKESFYRIGTPDGGVEAYYILKNGDEYGWQAKFFDSMGQSQWRQLEDSFKSAFEKHPHLVKYYICIPLDRADPRTENQHWFMDKWKEKVGQWKQYTKEKGRTVEFEYWGSSELLHQLTLEKHAGRTKYWFNQIELSSQWLTDRIERSILDLGARYTPELNFELDIAKNFDFIARDEHFKRQIYVAYDDILKKLSNTIDAIHDKDISEYKEKLQKDLEQLRNTYENINFSEIVPIHIDSITSTYDTIIMNITPLERYIYDWR